MKYLIILITFLISSAVFAYSTELRNISEEICPGAKLSKYDSLVTCSKVKDATHLAVLKIHTRKKIATLPENVAFLGAIELSILPDADTNEIYFFASEIQNSRGKTIGYVVNHAYVNPEMEVKIELESRFNLSGEFVSISIK